MKPNTTRSLLWLLAAAASIALAIGLFEAAKQLDPTSTLIATILVEASLGLASFLVFTTRGQAPAAHTRGRWSALDAIRNLVVALVFGFLVGLLAATLANVELSNPWLQLALLVPALASILCLVGAALERERFVRTRRAALATPPSAPRKVYETRTGAVVVEEHDGQKEVVLTGPKGRRDVDAVEREIDRRGWQDGERPENAELTDALQRWGVLRGNME